MLLIPARVGASSIHGLGVFAAQDLSKGTPVWKFLPGFDREFSPAEFEAFPALIQQHLRWFAYVNPETQGHVLSGDHCCFMNHSDAPNTGAPMTPFVPVTTLALRDIASGEELTCNYHSFDAEAHLKLR